MGLAIIALLLSQTPAPMAVQDPLTGKKARVEDCGTAKQCLDVNAISAVLPTGAATSAKQDTGNTSLASIDGKTPALVSGRQPVDGSGVVQPVSAATLPLPTGAATDATLSQLLDSGVQILGANRQPIAARSDGALFVVPLTLPLNPFLPRCNLVRRSNCQP